jgi:hypothetical protein
MPDPASITMLVDRGMLKRGRSRRSVVLALLGLLLLLPSSASAHVTKTSGPFRVTFGWGVEPPIAGFPNYVDVAVADASGAPVSGGKLQAEVSFGSSTETLALVPADEGGGVRADIVPTRPGTYAFRITGTVQGKPVDVAASCSEGTFECVTPASNVEFPVKDPSVGEIAQRVSRALPRAENSGGSDSAEGLAIAAIIVAVLALVAAVGFGVRGRRKSS